MQGDNDTQVTGTASTPGADAQGLTGNEMPRRVPATEQEAGAQVGAETIAGGDHAVRVVGTDEKMNADTQLGKKSAGYASGAPGSVGADYDELQDGIVKQGGAQAGGGNSELESRLHVIDGFIEDMGKRITALEETATSAGVQQQGGELSRWQEHAQKIAKLEALITELENRINNSAASPINAALPAQTGTGVMQPMDESAGSLERALRRAGIHPNPELDHIEEERERQEAEKATGDDAPAQVE